MRWFLVAGCAALLLAGSPAQAGTGGVDGLSVTVGDVVLTGYGCTTAPVMVSANVPTWAGWTIAVEAAPNGQQRLDAIGFGGRGPATDNGDVLICPTDSVGGWTATVSTRVFLTQNQFTLAFNVTALSTTTTIESARTANSSLKVRGTVLAVNGVPGRAALAVRGYRKGKWRTLGHTYARKSGTFRFVAPKRSTRVRVTYEGDSATLTSAANARVSTR